MSFQGKNVVVTGGNGALGATVVALLTAEGAACHVPSRHEGVDLADEDQVARFYTGLPPIWASLHLAGGFAAAPIEETPLADFRAMIDVNGTTCFLCCREAVRAMRRAGRGGRIVNVAARPVLAPVGGMAAYVASKAVVASLTQTLAREVAGDGILINAVVPSIMDSEANRRAMPDADHAKWPKVEEVARAIAFLASAENTLTSGALVPVYGRA